MEAISKTVLLIVIVVLILVILFLLFKKVNLSSVPPVGNIKGLINVKEGIDKQKVYVDHQYAYINSALQKNFPVTPFVPDNREAWFDLENLKAYIAYVERESTKQGLKNLGLRVYSAATFEEDGVPRSTYFFWPTNNSNAVKDAPQQKSAMPPGDDGDNSNSDGIDGLNYGQSGRPPAGFP